MSAPNLCPERSGGMRYKTRRLVMWCVGPRVLMSAHICPECFALFEKKGRCMSALPKTWKQGGAQAHDRKLGLADPLQQPIRRNF